ncbi:MAG: phosphomannomutase/phosphoglucomutase [Candidatus Nanohaloarchaea archaeon]|nr:phosphomannomutase/phosphoglucomutase [Candidatus Nanohaloarchaea archaeon]
MGLEDIFRAYDVRGSVPDQLDEDVMRRIGAGLAAQLQDAGEDTAVVGRDIRDSSPRLAAALIDGLTAADVDVVDAGLAPYGAVLFHARSSDASSAYVTASHLEKGFNGVKFAHRDGTGYVAEENDAVRQQVPDTVAAGGAGTVREVDVLPAYRDHLLPLVDLDGLDVVVDAGNGAASVAAADLFWKAGAATECLNCDPDGSFPNRPSDVAPENLAELRDLVADGRDMGVAYDGDADRLAVVDDTGRVLSAEEAAAVVLQHILPQEEGPVVANVECSRLVEDVAAGYGRDVVRTRVGHSYLFREVVERGACLGVEKSRHMAVTRFFPLDDGVAASLAVADAVQALDTPLSDAVDDLPTYERDRIAFDAAHDIKFDVVDRLQQELSQEYGDTDTTDGIRVDQEEGWILIRASNTSPVIRLTVEAETEEDFERLKEEFAGRLQDAIDAAS